MFHNSKGNLLLALLVVTGLAGSDASETISGSERRFLVSHLRETKNTLKKSIKGLSDEQLNYKADSSRLSIRECMYALTQTEEGLWKKVDAATKQPARPEKTTMVNMSDEDLLKMVMNKSADKEILEMLLRHKLPRKTPDAVLADFKEKHNHLITYAQTTTDNLRNYKVYTELGTLDAYQLMLLISGYARNRVQHIEEIKNDPGFQALNNRKKGFSRLFSGSM